MVGALPVNLITTFYKDNMDSCGGIEENMQHNVCVGSRVKCNNSFGTVKFLGQVSGYNGVWYGVDWDDEARGKHNGTVDGVQYFVASKPTSGSFIRPNKINASQTCEEAIRKNYGDKEDENTTAIQKAVIKELKREMNVPFIEMVGFDRIEQKQGKFETLLEVCLDDKCIDRAGDLRTLCPNLRYLGLSRSLLDCWQTVADIVCQLPHLYHLDLSRNKMPIDMRNEKYKQLSEHFRSLEKMNLSYCDYDWSDIAMLSLMWPRIEELILAYNRISTIEEHPCLSFTRLTCLRLDGNPISDWSEVMKLGRLERLTSLSLNDCLIECIRFNDNTDRSKVDLFENLKVLFIKGNRINNVSICFSERLVHKIIYEGKVTEEKSAKVFYCSTHGKRILVRKSGKVVVNDFDLGVTGRKWRSISELDKLKNLMKLYFLKNPIQETVGYDTCSQFVIAKIGKLQVLNSSLLSRELRRGAEYDYLKMYGLEWKNAQADEEAKTRFAIEHHRFEQLVETYSLPEDSLIERKPQNTSLTSQLIEITMKDVLNGATIKKKFPSSMAVQKLAVMADRIFAKNHKVKAGRPVLYCLDEQRDNMEICLDNDMKDLNYFSVKNGDTILVKWS